MARFLSSPKQDGCLQPSIFAFDVSKPARALLYCSTVNDSGLTYTAIIWRPPYVGFPLSRAIDESAYSAISPKGERNRANDQLLERVRCRVRAELLAAILCWSAVRGEQPHVDEHGENVGSLPVSADARAPPPPRVNR